MNTHGGHYNPAWRTTVALVPDEQNWSQRRPGSETSPFNIEDHISLRHEEIHIRELAHTDSRLQALNMKDFFDSSDILIDKTATDSALGEGSQGVILKCSIRGRPNAVFAVKCSESAEILDEFCMVKQFSHPSACRLYPPTWFWRLTDLFLALLRCSASGRLLTRRVCL